MKYTVNSFIRALVGDYEELKKTMEYDKPLLKWDGMKIYFYSKQNYPLESCYLDVIYFFKTKKSYFLNLHSKNYWDFEIQFSDKGLIKNKEYKIKDAFKKLK